MEKLNFHETLRIYVPGLYCCMIIYLLITQTFININHVLLPALFVAFALNGFLTQNSTKRFNNLVDNFHFALHAHKQNFDTHLTDLLKIKNEQYNTRIDAELVPKSSYLQKAFFSRIYDTPELLYFRSPKTLGTMAYHLFILAIIVPAFFLALSLMTLTLPSHFQMSIILLSLLFGWSFHRTADAFFKDSLKRELHYWSKINEEQCNELERLCRLNEKLHLIADSQV